MRSRRVSSSRRPVFIRGTVIGGIVVSLFAPAAASARLGARPASPSRSFVSLHLAHTRGETLIGRRVGNSACTFPSFRLILGPADRAVEARSAKVDLANCRENLVIGVPRVGAGLTGARAQILKLQGTMSHAASGRQPVSRAALSRRSRGGQRFGPSVAHLAGALGGGCHYAPCYRYPTHPTAACAAGDSNVNGEANAFYVSPAQSEVETWTDAGLDYCASALSSASSASCSPENQAWTAYGLAAVNFGEMWSDDSSDGPAVQTTGTVSGCVTTGVQTQDSMTSSTFCATDNPSGGQTGAQHTQYSPTQLNLAADGTMTETVAAQTVGPCAARLQLRAQLIRWATPEGAPGYDLTTAARFAPQLYFDSSEKWRPLNVDGFLAEQFPPTVVMLPGGAGSTSVALGGHKICGSHAPIDCRATTGSGDLDGPYGAADYLDISGSGQPSNYASPNPACNQNGLQDCNAGPASAIYYHSVITNTTTQYTFYDYWFLYRFNDFAYTNMTGGIDDHEGDWEGVTVAPSLGTPGTFDFASFSQHGTWYSYARNTLSCDGERQSGTCQGINNLPAGQRIDVFPTNGGHTNYPTVCASNCWQDNGLKLPVLGLPLVPEAPHDGTAPWGNNTGMTSGSLIALPPVDHLRWVDFPGRWGNAADPNNNPVSALFGLDGTAPRSPGCQYPHFAHPDLGGGMQNGCAATSGQAYASSLRQSTGGPRASASSVTRPDIGPRDCPDWFAADVAILICDRAALGTAITTGSVGTVPDANITMTGVVSGGGHGVDQALAPPLRPGQSVTLKLPSTGSPVVYVHWLDATGTARDYITQVDNPGGRTGRMTVPLDGTQPQLAITP